MQQPGYNVPHTQARGEPMQSPEDVAAMLRLKACGWGTQRIADELGVSRNTVKRYLRQGGWAPYASPQRTKSLDGLGVWLCARRLNQGKFHWAGNLHGDRVALCPEQVTALVQGRPWQRLGAGGVISMV